MTITGTISDQAGNVILEDLEIELSEDTDSRSAPVGVAVLPIPLILEPGNYHLQLKDGRAGNITLKADTEMTLVDGEGTTIITIRVSNLAAPPDS